MEVKKKNITKIFVVESQGAVVSGCFVLRTLHWSL